MRYLVLAALIFVLSTASFAADNPAAEPGHESAPHAAAEDAKYPHPGVPDHPAWAKNLVAAIGLMFIAAALMGPVVRAVMPQQVEPPHAHEETGHGAHDDPHTPHAPGTHPHGPSAHH